MTTAQMPETAASYLQTLRRVPDEVILDMAARPIDPACGLTCVAAWAMREAIAVEKGQNADDCEPSYWRGIHDVVAGAFGGSPEEWEAIDGACTSGENVALLELAFVDRVLEAVAA